MDKHPTTADLQQIEDESDPLDALFEEAQLHAPPRKHRAKGIDPREAARVAEHKLHEVYANPENWERRRGLALIDAESGTLLGNFSEYIHRFVPATRKLLREHAPISVDATEAINGYLGVQLEQELRGQTWEKEQEIEVLVQLDELMVEAPYVCLIVRTRFGGIVQARLVADTQFASPSGNVLLQLPAGTDIWRATSVDTKVSIRKAVTL